MASKTLQSFSKIHDTAKRAWAGEDWSVVINAHGITINDGIEDLSEEADPDEAAEIFDEATSNE